MRLGLFPITHDLIREAGAQLAETERLYAFLGRMAKGVRITSRAREPSPPTIPPPQLVGAAA